MKAEKIKNISEAVDFAHGAGAPLPSPWGRWRGAALRRTATDESSPPLADLTAARTFANLWSAAVAASAPSEEGAVGLHKGFEQYD